MKRSEAIQLIIDLVYKASYADLELTKEEAEEVLSGVEQIGFSLVDDDGSRCEYEPEEGWDAWLEYQDKKDQARDFQIVNGLTDRAKDIAEKFLSGKSFEEIAQEYNVTRERIRQIVDKARRKFIRVQFEKFAEWSDSNEKK